MRRRGILALVFAIFFCSAESLWGQETDIALAYQQIDAAFVKESSDELASVLKSYQATKEYYLCESYTLKKTRQYIIQDKLPFARAAALVVIDNNIDNFDAIDLYSYIDKAVLAKEAEQQAEENRRQLERDRKAAADARTKQRIESGDTYQAVNTSSGKTVFINEQQAAYSPVRWTVKLGLADVMYQKISDPDYSSIKYGLSVGADMFYTTEAFVLGGEVYGSFNMLTMGTGEEEVMTSFRFVPELAFTGLSRNLFLRMGYAVYAVSSEKLDVSGTVDTFNTPVIGLGIENLTIGETALALHYDYCLGHFAYEDLTSAMEMGASVLLPLNVNERTKIGIVLSASDLLFMKETGMENRIKATFAIGVGNVIK